MENKKFRITVQTLTGSTLVFTVSEFNIDDAGLVQFTDEKTGLAKQFHASRCDIEEVRV